MSLPAFLKLNWKTLGYVIGALFLIVSSYDLLGNPEYQSTQVGFALGYNFWILLAVTKRINSIKIIKKEQIDKIQKMHEHFKIFFSVLLPCFTLFSGFVLYLANKEIFSIFFSSVWLEGLIIFMQTACFVILTYQLAHNFTEKTVHWTFAACYTILSVIFGWTSAQIAFAILKLPAQQDLFIVSYGTLLIPIIFILYFDSVYEYKTVM